MSAALLGLSEAELKRTRELKRKTDREELGTFIPSISSHYETPQHLDPLLKLLERARTEGNVRAVVSTPPRHGKTETLLHSLAHRVYRDPSKINGYVTYAKRLADSKARTHRRIAKAAGIRMETSSLGDWRTARRGGVITTSIGGGLTGEGITGELLVDDPFKGRREAESALVRESTWEWFNDVAYTRLQPGASCIVVATRWHIDDLSGRLLAHPSGKWEHVNLPAIDAHGKALWPSQYSVKILEEIRAQVGEYTWASLYQGMPRPKGGQLFYEPATYPELAPPYRIVISCDPAATEDTHSDYTAIGVLGFRDHGMDLQCDVLEVIRVQKSIPDVVKLLVDLQEKWKPQSATGIAPIVVEAVGGFKAVPQMLRKIDRKLDIHEVHPTTDKFIRAQPAAAAWNRGRIRVPVTATWLGPFKAEVQAFTGINDVTDDQVDMISHGWNHESERVGVSTENERPNPDERYDGDGDDDESPDELAVRRRIERRVMEMSRWRK